MERITGIIEILEPKNEIMKLWGIEPGRECWPSLIRGDAMSEAAAAKPGGNNRAWDWRQQWEFD